MLLLLTKVSHRVRRVFRLQQLFNRNLWNEQLDLKREGGGESEIKLQTLTGTNFPK